MSKATPRGEAWAPSGKVQFSPVPFKLLRSTAMGRSGNEEYVAGQDMGEYQGMPFDPWARGDLVAVEWESSYWHRDKGTVRHAVWEIGRRANTPSAPRVKIAVGIASFITVGGPSGIAAVLWRIPYRWRPAAAALIGQQFETREALEAAMDPIQVSRPESCEAAE